MSEKVLPCPFCGSANVHAYTYKDAVYRQYAVKCKKCGARIMAQSTELSIEKWNRRAERTAKVVFERLEEDVKIGAGTFRKGTTVLRKCSACDGWVKPGDTYCYHCGAKLDWSE